jgi:phage tail sheath protein FI
MPFQLSPGVAVVEKDFSAIVPAVATSAGAFAGVFAWGPVLDPVTITSENVLVQRFGKPTDSNFDSFFTAANFLAYTNNLLVVRVDTADAKNAVATGTAVKIKNFDQYSTSYSNGQGTVGEWAAKYPGALGNSLKVSMADSQTFTGWTYADEFDSAPSTSAFATLVGSTNDEIHVIVVDEDGLWTGERGAILEKFSYVSKASNAVKSDGTNNYYKNVINSQSKYIWWMDHTSAVTTTVAGVGTSGVNWGTDALSNGFKDLTGVVTKSLAGGVDDLSATDGELQAGFAIFANAEQYDISLIPVGKVSETVAEYVINNVAEVRLDCVAFISPQYIVGNASGGTDGDVIQGGTLSDMVDALNEYRNELPSSSYAVLDSGSKYQYDRYNDKYRFVPLNGDIAGLSARTDYTNDPWYSPAGLNRGQVKNVVKLAVNPGKTERDNLYKNGVNPVVNFPGQGTVLFGDKTLLAKPSAFDRINVRRLFIVLEKAIATAAKYQLFEFNDSFTRAQFKNLIEPFLRDVQGRRGVTDFRVKCDDTNNTGEVIDRNEFIADIFIKPNRSINFITLNFIAARSAVSFSEIGA